MLWAGLALTAIAWLALVVVVAHGRYVTEAVAAGEYGKGPFRDRGRNAEGIPDDTDEREEEPGDEGE